MTSSMPAPSLGTAQTSELSCQTRANGSHTPRRGTRTLPVRAMRPRSLRTRSTIMTFSATSLALVTSAAAACRSSSAVRPAAGGALHRPAPQYPVRPLEEQLRAGTDDRRPTEVEQRVVRGLLSVHEVGVHRRQVAADGGGQAGGEVRLVDRAGRDLVADVLHRRGVLVRRDGRSPRRRVVRPRLRCRGDERCLLRRPAHAEPGQWPRLRMHGQTRIEAGRRLVGEVPERPLPAGRDPVELGEQRPHLLGPVRDQYSGRRREHQRRAVEHVVEACTRHGRILARVATRHVIPAAPVAGRSCARERCHQRVVHAGAMNTG